MYRLRCFTFLCCLLLISACANTPPPPTPTPPHTSRVLSFLRFLNQVRPSEVAKKTIEINVPDDFPFKKDIIVFAAPFEPYTHRTIIKLGGNYDFSFCLCGYSVQEVIIGKLNFTRPRFPRDAEIQESHEIFHTIDSVAHKSRYAKQHRALEKAFDMFIVVSKYDSKKLMGSPFYHLKEVEHKALFSLIDESNYVGEHPSPFGHPYSNHSELFASMLTVTRMFPDQFLLNLQKLSLKEKETVSVAYFASINILLAIHNDKNDLQTLLPDHNRIATALLPYQDQTSQ